MGATRTSAYADFLNLVNGYQVSQAIYAAATLGIADHLHDTPRDVDELASLTACHPGALYRLLRALAAVGVFHEDDNKRFSLTEIGECLRSDSPTPMAGWAAYIGRPYHWQSWGHLLHSVRTGEVAFQDLYQQSVWDLRAADPEESAIFDRAMTTNSQSTLQAIVAAYDFGQFGHVADIGGGQGHLLSGILSANPQLRGTLFDQPHVVARAQEVFARHGLSERCTIVPGSFFETAPAGADAYLLKSIVHDWDDDDAISILKVCRRAMGVNAKLLLIERPIGRPNESTINKFSDVNMLVMLGGRERTPEQYAELCQAAGFRFRRIVQAGMFFGIIEAEPVQM
jgi:hypothetical protein